MNIIVTDFSRGARGVLSQHCSGPCSDEHESKLYSRYENIMNILDPYQRVVEKSAMSVEVSNWIEESKKVIEEASAGASIKSDILTRNPLIYLNNHGPEHVTKVIAKATELIMGLSNVDLSYYELFLLLCAIELHDVGNIFGRNSHEKSIGPILERITAFVPDTAERTCIHRIAMAHGGRIYGDKDTIHNLQKNRKLFNKPVKEQFLAAILRLADELADDSDRTSKAELELDIIADESKIYHYYSQSLHTVEIVNDMNGRYINLVYEFESVVAKKIFRKLSQDRYLLDEIYDRTIKMERERRYCARFLRPGISVEGIKVEIIIQSSTDPFSSKSITYTLSEIGYPDAPQIGSISEVTENSPTGADIAAYFENE